jgi:transcriptional regulator with XRE-family HTH domain
VTCVTESSNTFFLGAQIDIILRVRRPLSQIEKNIGARLREWREALLLPRAKVARKIKIGGERLASYEDGRAPLRFDVFLALWQTFKLNPEWLATGRLPREMAFISFESLIPIASIEPGARFSEIFETTLRPILEGNANVRLLSVLNRADEEVNALVASVKRGEDSKGEAQRSLKVKLLKLGIIEEGIILDTLALPKLTNDAILNPMKTDGASLLLNLRKSLKKATARRGVKTKLARDFGVSQATVTEWINGPAKPSAENVLRLLHWLERNDGTQNKKTDIGSARPDKKKSKK